MFSSSAAQSLSGWSNVLAQPFTRRLVCSEVLLLVAVTYDGLLGEVHTVQPEAPRPSSARHATEIENIRKAAKLNKMMGFFYLSVGRN